MATRSPAKTAALFATAVFGGPIAIGLTSGEWWPALLVAVIAYPVAFLILFAVADWKSRR